MFAFGFPFTKFSNVNKVLRSLTSTLGSADEGRSRRPGPTLARSGEKHTDVVFCIWVQVPELIGEHVDSKNLRPGGLTSPIFDFPPNDGAVAQDGVGVELNNQIRGACSQQLGWGNRRWRNCNGEKSKSYKKQSKTTYRAC